MILSFEHKFLFIKTAKTAGTSVEIALSRHCGPRDVITPISPADEAMRRELGGRGPQRFRVPLARYTTADWRGLLLRGRRAKLYNHIPASALRPRLGPAVWDGVFRFCIERNPWDKAVSLYHWIGVKRGMTIEEFVASDRLLANRRRGLDLYTINGEMAVDRVVRFERLGDELNEVATELGLPPLDLPRAKSGARRDKRHYREVLGPRERDRIAEVFAHEIELFGYEF